MESPTSAKSSPSEPSVAASTTSNPAASKTVKTPRVLACVLCQQRKVKCDRRSPCTNCVKARVQCLASTPAPPRRRRKKNPGTEDDLIKKIEKYEAMLKSYGENIEATDEQDGEEISPFGEATPSEDGHGVQFEDDSDSGFPDIGGLVLDACAPSTNITSMHPSAMNIFRLWQTFLDNVNPVIKISHAPTVQKMVLEASSDLSTVSKPMEALLFAIYSAAVNSLTNDECEAMLGKKKLESLRKFHSATLRALQRVQFLRTNDPIVLQAFVLFLVSARTYYNTKTQWVLSGVAVRIAQGMNLHRDPGNGVSNFTPFEIEMRRRLWWAIVLVDGRLAAAVGGASSILAGDFDTKVPLNVNDSDLSPSMHSLPTARVGSTEFIFALARYEINNFLRTTRDDASISAFNGSWAKLGSPELSAAVKDAAVDGLNQSLEKNFLAYCDASIPLHLLTIGLVRVAVAGLRLVAHHPRHYPGGITGMPASERDMLFETCIMSVAFDNIAQTSPLVSRFLWHINNHFALDAFVFMLSELRHRTSGPNVERAWGLVYDAYEYHPEMASLIRKNPIYEALGNLVLKAWEVRQFHLGNFQGDDKQVPIPKFIVKLFELRAPGVQSPASRKRSVASPGLDAQADFIDTGELIEELDAPSSVSPEYTTDSLQQPGLMSWDGTMNIGMDMNTDLSGDGQAIDWANVIMPFDINANVDPMMVFDTLPVDTQPMDWEFWGGFMPSTGNASYGII